MIYRPKASGSKFPQMQDLRSAFHHGEKVKGERFIGSEEKAEYQKPVLNKAGKQAVNILCISAAVVSG